MSNIEESAPLRFRDLDGIKELLIKEAELQGLNGYSELVRRYCRSGLRGESIDYEPFNLLRDTLLENIRETNKIGTNMNQLVYLLHVHGIRPSDIPKICEALTQVNDSLLENVTISREALNELRRI